MSVLTVEQWKLAYDIHGGRGLPAEDRDRAYDAVVMAERELDTEL